MSEEATRSGGLWMPYPLLGMFLTLVLVLGGGLIALYSQLSAMNATMIMRDNDYRDDQRKAWEKIEQLQVYIKDDREKLVGQEKEIEFLRERRRN